eukprot:COSAG01_NODE_71771_length_255_cov_0.487179_1_plen_52_part_00
MAVLAAQATKDKVKNDIVRFMKNDLDLRKNQVGARAGRALYDALMTRRARH